ncbi:MAG: virulence factor [Mangrovicoccus sp.]|nr:virulence factor [Mangrovicoccus sp.]
MPESIIVYWRDIPAQVIVGKGRRAAKIQLPERFEQAIDRAAMISGAAATDAYLAEWRKAPGPALDGSAEDVASQIAADLDSHYSQDKIKALIAGKGWDSAPQAEEP